MRSLPLASAPRRILATLLVSVAAACVAIVAGCGSRETVVVVYTVQDRVFAEPLLRRAGEELGLSIRAVYDNEANKGAALAQRLIAEADRPRADLWWSNEEMRTRQLVRAGVLVEPVRSFGLRRRVLVTSMDESLPAGTPGLHLLTNAAYRGQVVLAYPFFGTTTGHLLALRQRWGTNRWEAWCHALAENRPLLVDGNSRVVKAVAAGQARLGVTDSDDVRFAVREGLRVVAHELPPSEDLVIPNTVAQVRNSPQPEAAQRVARWLTGPAAIGSLVEAGGSDAPGDGRAATAEDWSGMLADLDDGLAALKRWFARAP